MKTTSIKPSGKTFATPTRNTTPRMTPADTIMALDSLDDGSITVTLPITLALEDWLWLKTGAANSGKSLAAFASFALSRAEFSDLENELRED